MAQVHYVVKTQDLPSQIGRWSLRGGIDWREWDDEVVVRLEQSGGTYLLSALAGYVLIALHEGASYVDEIAARIFGADAVASPSVTASLAARFSSQAPEAQRVQETLTQLQAIGIVRSNLN
jgi:hypothetical protein